MKIRDMFYQNTQHVIPEENNNDEYNNRITRLEKQVKNLDSRLQKLETKEDDSTDNFYMI